MTLTEVLNHLGNYFEKEYEYGNYSISAKTILTKKSYKKGQYVRIMDSFSNDGIYKVDYYFEGVLTLEGELTDEEFTGYIVSLAVPNDIVEVVPKMDAYEKKVSGGVNSETIPNYSVTYSSEDTFSKFGYILSTYSKLNLGKYHFVQELEDE